MICRREQFAVQSGLSRQLDPAGKKTALRFALDGLLDRSRTRSMASAVARTVHRHRQMDPAHAINMERRDLLDLAVLDRNKRSAFRAAFPDVPALQIAAEDNMRPLVENGGLMHMRERPIVVALVDQVLDGAWRIIRVSLHPAQAGVQDADIEAAGNRRRISGDKIVRDVALPEALAVQGTLRSGSSKVSGLRAENTLTLSGRAAGG